MGEPKVGDMEIVDVADALGSAVSRIRVLEPDRPIAKSLEIDAALVLANPAMLEQVFFNLIENAVNYTDVDTAIWLSIETTADRAEIRVTDEGPGIAADELPHIFERFFRSTSSREKAGQGLGLSIAKGFIEAFGGSICAISPVASCRGTQILITMPLAKKVSAHG
jgi:two-component system sensor histidine kinase KdpD